MKHEDYLITTAAGNSSRKLIWHSHEPLPLDHPARYLLEKGPNGEILVRDSSVTKDPELSDGGFSREGVYRVRPGELDGQSWLEITPRPGTGASKPVKFSIRRLTPIRAAYLPEDHGQLPVDGEKAEQLFIFFGTRFFLTSFEPLGNSYRGEIEGIPVFRIVNRRGQYQITALQPGLSLQKGSGEVLPIPVGRTITALERDLAEGQLGVEQNWWKFRNVYLPEPLPPNSFKEELLVEKLWLERISYTVGFLTFVMLVSIGLYSRHIKKLEKPVEPPATISLKKPKIVPPLPKPQPSPVVIPPKPEPPKPKPEPPKPVEKPKPPEKRPDKPKLPPGPPPKAPPKSQQKPAAKAPPPPPGPVAPAQPAAPPPPTAEQIAAQKAAEQQARLSKSLSFLPKSPGKFNVAANRNITQEAKYSGNGIPPANARSQKDYLEKESAPTPTGPIKTGVGDRRLGSAAVAQQLQGGKALNQVLAKVSVSSLYSGGAAEGIAGATGKGGGGAQVTGSGQLSQSEIEKTLMKHLQKLTYCYEKALLYRSDLSGKLTMGWTIDGTGAVLAAHVVNSQLGDPKLHDCVVKELRQIRFPAPRGGTVQVQYPFSFTASTY